MTLVILALDALDTALIEHFDIDSYTLTHHAPMETVAYMRDEPYTPEAWATAATGLHPRDHGVSGSGTSEWSNPLLQLASKFTAHLGEDTRGRLGALVTENTNERVAVGRVSEPSIFDTPNAVVRNWPGITDGSDLQFAWTLMSDAIDGAPRSTFERELFGLCAEQFAWAIEMCNHNVSLAGVHIHTLDAAGHAYCDDEGALEHVYRRVGTFVDHLVEQLGTDDELLILSDHGMTVSFYSDEADGSESGSHSWRAYASSTTGPLPPEIGDLPKWVETNLEPVGRAGSDDPVHIPEQQLRDLGYL
jgi:hypothetical protein